MIPGMIREYESDNTPPDALHGYVSVAGAKSVFGEKAVERPKSSRGFQASPSDIETVSNDLAKAGFTIVAQSRLGLAVSGPPGAYEELTGGKIAMKERLMYADCACIRYVTHADIVGERQSKTLGVGYAKSKALKIDGVLLERPRMYHSVFPSPLPPNVQPYHLRVPGDVATLLGAQAAHQQGTRGEGVQVVMPDSGQYRHPYFMSHGYSLKTAIAMVPGTRRSKDPVGHGTGESANIFAAAPGATVQPIRTTNNAGDMVAAIGGFLKAKELKPNIITNSWGGDGEYPPSGQPDEADQAWALEIQDAIEQGILVIFSAGNGQFSIEPQVPGVLAAGGVFVSRELTMRASNYASGYASPWFQGITVPTVCGLVGLLPRAQYIMLPVPPGSELDIEESQPVEDDPNTDGTTASDGWALFSGTSAAAPQLAGVAALILGAKPGLKPAQVIEALTKTATDVLSGRCHPRFDNSAVIGEDTATGFGLVNAMAAVSYARAHF